MSRKKNKYFLPLLGILLFLTLIAAIAFGAVSIRPDEMLSSLKHYFQGQRPASIYEAVFIQIRLPRVLLCAVTGSVLALSGVLMQGLFRNPIVEPGLAGTSSGAAFGASVVFVLSSSFSPELKIYANTFLVPLMAFAGGLIATFLVYTLARNARSVSIISLLLVGIAVNAVALSGTGFMSYIARDPQARDITFWNLGTFARATWTQFFITGAVSIVIFIYALRFSKQLNALLLGEEEASYLGVDTEKLKRRVMILNTIMVSVATAFVGVIGFVGLIVPHMLRLVIGSDNKKLLPASMLAGSILLVMADTGARLLLAPYDENRCIITSIVGAPVFIILLKRSNILQKGGQHA